MIEQILQLTESDMKKTINAWKEYATTIRTGRANVSILDKVMVNFYGTPTPISQTSQINTPEPQLITIKPYDRSQISEIVGGINKAGLGLNPIADAEIIRINIPPLTQEIRKELAKKVNKELEVFKIRIRNERRNAIDSAKKNKDISEDLVKDVEKQIQTLTDKYTKELDDLAKAKEKELMTI
ncbi:ribosome recycling factor [Williamsoniiplasma somnilux]|uniref:Ribosome-recycling factor n=1 Tax=Williamsoniiplasma somnilux TaxID=215578 RepID=A0A2K8NYG8_9MOLU|nr:ribosome recycling factor [Williamsoniiplasma somnilux]ATZ18860.1 ribosome recycling factor [Williamsoniiplasma somnilux]